MPIVRNQLVTQGFNPRAILPYELRLRDFEMAMQDVYDFFFDVNRGLVEKNPRGELGTRTATLHRKGIEKLRQNWIYRSSV